MSLAAIASIIFSSSIAAITQSSTAQPGGSNEAPIHTGVLINPKMVNLMVNSALDNSAKKGPNMVDYFKNLCSK